MTASVEHKIERPDPKRPPLQANVFQAVRSANTSLVPMFPYCQDGCLVPGATVFYGGQGRGIGAFNHMNSVDEVAICFASQGSGIRSGDVFAGAREHLVGSFFDEEEADTNLMVIAVVQRQAEGVPQHEGVSFLCESCQTQLLRHEYPAKNDRDYDAEDLSAAPPLDTLIEGAVCAREYNASVDRRTCPNCGHVNPRFPVEIWGWDAYHDAYVASEAARRRYLSLAAGAR